MPPLPGEETFATLFADVHTYFTPPSHAKPHHRFDKSSYVYVYYSSIQRRGRIEVANSPGTANQDAFAGTLDNAEVIYNYKRSTFITLNLLRPPQHGSQDWHLPAFDPRNENKYLYPIVSLDIYLWSSADGTTLLNAFKKVPTLGAKTLTEDPNRQSMVSDQNDVNPVIQKLEQAALTGGSYDDIARRTGSVKSESQSFPPPPPNTTALSGSRSPSNAENGSTKTYTPIAYNPAAPAAPEPIAHREKTPPPIDAASGTGLNHAAKLDTGVITPNQPFQPQFSQPQPQQSYPPGPGYLQQSSSFPVQQLHQTPSFHGSTSPPGPQRAPTFPPPPPSGGPLQQQPSGGYNPTAQAAYAVNQQQRPPMGPSYGSQASAPSQPLGSSSTGSPYPQQSQQQSNNYVSPLTPPASQYPFQNTTGMPNTVSPPQQQPPPPQLPTSQYSSHSQSGTPQQGSPSLQQPPQDPYSIHNQVYRPTEADAAAHPKHGYVAGQPAQSGPGQAPGRFEARAEKVEKGVNRLLKRLDKKF